jgi:hypothetical protein
MKFGDDFLIFELVAGPRLELDDFGSLRCGRAQGCNQKSSRDCEVQDK